jgi:multiple sugar transport system substrate-binding protein
MIELKGMTWDHSRGYDPMIATSKIFAEKHNNEISIHWDKRSLQAFADRPIEQMVEEYDLMVIDYPHVGEVSAKGLLQMFDVDGYQHKLNLLDKQSVGLSHQSYNIDGHQWALAIDAATQVCCFRQDLISSLPNSWNDLIDLAKENRVIWPLKPVHAISSFYSIYNNIAEEFNPNDKNYIQKELGVQTLLMMKQISKYLLDECFTMDPIKTAETLSETEDFFYSPYTYGFSNYSRKAYRKNIISYGNVIDLSNKGPSGTHLGGTGIAISKKSKHKDLALEYSFWIAGSDCQQTTFYTSGGQPGNSDAWENYNINLETNNFFKNTRSTLDKAWVRPRHNGYMKFQDESGNIINEYLQSNMSEAKVIDKLTSKYAESFEE